MAMCVPCALGLVAVLPKGTSGAAPANVPPRFDMPLDRVLGARMRNLYEPDVVPLNEPTRTTYVVLAASAVVSVSAPLTPKVSARAICVPLVLKTLITPSNPPLNDAAIVTPVAVSNDTGVVNWK